MYVILIWFVVGINLGLSLHLNELDIRDDGSEIGKLKMKLFRGVLPQMFIKETKGNNETNTNTNININVNKKESHKLRHK
jgi:hypothetical protein